MRAPMIVSAGLLAFLEGCAPNVLTLPVQGIVQNSRETFSGSATGFSDGSGYLDVYTSTGVTCRGNFLYTTRRTGRGVFQCSDGRSGPFNFVSTGYSGIGEGSLGTEYFTFTFG